MKHIPYSTLLEWQRQGRPHCLLDVRDDCERTAFHIGGEHIPLTELMLRKGELKGADEPIVVYCKRGIRSQIAIQRLQPHFPNTDFYNLDNGIIRLLANDTE